MKTTAAQPVPAENGQFPLAPSIAAALVAGTPLALAVGPFLTHDVMPKVVLLLVGSALLLFLFPQWSPGWRLLLKGRAGHWFFALLSLQCFSLTISTVLSVNPALSLVGTTWRRFGASEQFAALVVAAVVAACAVQRGPAWVTLLLRAMSLGGAVAAIYAISQYFGFDPFLERRLYQLGYLGGLVRPPATTGHAIYFSSWLAPVSLIAAYLAFTETANRWRSAMAAVAGMALIGIVLSGSRGALLAVLIGALVLAGTMRKSARPLLKAAALVSIAIAGILATPAGTPLRHRIQQWREDPGTARLGIWRESPSLIASHPLFGTGPETFTGVFRAVESPGLSRAYPDFIQETPHNAFIDAACAQGLPGLAVLLALAATVFLPGPAGFRAAMAASLVAAIFASFSLMSFLGCWVFAGLLAAASPRVGIVHNSNIGNLSRDGLLAVPATLAGGVLLVLALALGVQDAAYADLRTAVTGKDLAAADASYAKAITFVIGLPGYELWSSQQMALLGRALGNTPEGSAAWRKAGEAAQLAEHRGEQGFSSAYQSAILALAAANIAQAEAKARETIVLAPNWYKPHLLRAQILEATGHHPEAVAEAQRSIELGWKQPNQGR